MSAQIRFLPATAEDYDELMSISVGIYNGTDYLPYIYHAWLKDPRRRMFLAKSEGKIAVISVLLPSDQLERALKLLEGRVDNLQTSKNHCVLGPTEVLKLFEETKIAKELLPGEILIQDWLPITTQRANLELLIEQGIVWIYTPLCGTSDLLAFSCNYTKSDIKRHQPSHEHSVITPATLTPSSDPRSTTQGPHTSDPLLSSINNSSPGFLSLGSPLYTVPLAKGMHVLEVDLFGNDPVSAKVHFLQQLKMGIKGLPAMSDVICVLYAEENLRAEFNQLLEGLTPFNRMRKQLLLEMNI
ncbi:histidine N-acetyltransferase-like [Mixophyes fleayi]|uniref:histidine N-acetyltransferase-like n=1 Tax=Mixophyes fleayi TaxID=3061075 RepID=UPI003F4E409B